MMRLLTLFCFFHFSGLNNGFSYLISMAGNAQAMNLTAMLARNLAPTFNPANWKQFLSKNKWYRLFSGSNQMFQSSCKNVVQDALLNVDFFEIGYEQDLIKKLSKVFSFAQNSENSSISSVLKKAVQILLTIPFIIATDKADGVLGYLYHKERWLKIAPSDFWDWHKYKKKDRPPGSTRRQNPSLQNLSDLEKSNNNLRAFTDVHRDKLFNWIIHNISGRNDTLDSHLKSLKDQQEIIPIQN